MREMPTIVLVVCFATSAIVLLYMAAQFLQRKHDLLSYRNFYLLAFVHFQCLSGFLGGLTGEPWRGQPFATSSYHIYGVCLVLFLILFLWAYRLEKIPRFVGHIFPSRSPMPTPMWVLIAIACGVMASAVCIVIVQSGVAFFSQLAAQVVFGGLIFAAVLATHLWTSQPANPFYALMVIGLALGTMALATLGAYGRRDLVSVAAGVIWGMYLLRWRYQPTGKTIFKFAAVGSIGLAILVAYTSVRGAQRGVFGLQEEDMAAVAKHRISALADRSLMEQGMLPILFTDTGNNSMYIIDRWGTADLPHEPFYSLKYLLVNPIPRIWWPDKPVGFGKVLPLSMNHKEFNNLTLGPGVIGHGWHEMGIFGVAFYAVFFAILAKAVDEKLMRQVRNPFFVAATGTMLGHLIGMPRGDIGNFMVNSIGAMLAPFSIIVILGVLSGGGGREAAAAELAAMQEEDEWDGDFDDDHADTAAEYADYADPDYDELQAEDAAVG